MCSFADDCGIISSYVNSQKSQNCKVKIPFKTFSQAL